MAKGRRRRLRKDIEEANAAALAAALEARGVAVATLSGARRPGEPPVQWITFRLHGHHHFFRSGKLLVGEEADILRARHVNGRCVPLTANKHGAKRRLRAAGVPVAPGALFRADEAGRALGWYLASGEVCCVKPNDGKEGRGVTTHVADAATFAAAFARVAANGHEVLVERQIEGNVLRVNCFDGRVVGQRMCRAASVLGDGRSTVAELVVLKNAERAQRAMVIHKLLQIDEEARRHLARQGLAPDSVPETGRRVFLRGTSNIVTGGDVVTDLPGLHPDHAALALRACAAFPGLRNAGLDIMVRDMARPGGHAVLEINSSPGIANFLEVWRGEPVDVAGAMADLLIDA